MKLLTRQVLASRSRRSQAGSFASGLLTFSLLMLVMALGFVFGRVVIARAYVRTTSDLKKTGAAPKPAGQEVASPGLAGTVGEVQAETAPTTPETPDQSGAGQEAAPPADQGTPSADQGVTGDNTDAGGAAPELPAAPSRELKYSIQIGAFGSENGAHQVATRLTRAGYPATIEVDTAHNSYKVLVGRFGSEAEARRALGRVQSGGFPEAFMVAR